MRSRVALQLVGVVGHDIRVTPDHHRLVVVLRGGQRRISLMPNLFVMAAKLDMVVGSVESKSAFEQGILAIAVDGYPCPTSLCPSLSPSTLYKGIALEDPVVAALDGLDGFDLAVGAQVGDGKVVVQNVVIGLELEPDLLLSVVK